MTDVSKTFDMHRVIGIHILIVHMFVYAYNKAICEADVYTMYVYTYTKFVDVYQKYRAAKVGLQFFVWKII